MEAIRKQATKLREQVAKQQQAVLKQFAGGLGGSDNSVSNEVEVLQHQKLEKLYISTRAAKHFQRDIVRGVEGDIVTGSKLLEIGNRSSEYSRKYGAENTCTSGNTLSKVALSYSRARAEIEKERENLLKALGTQMLMLTCLICKPSCKAWEKVAEPLRAMVTGAPLEDARHLAQRYDRVKQETEAQVIEVARRQVKVRDSNVDPDNILKLEAAEAKLQGLNSNMAKLGKEAAAAMAAVECQQQRLTLQRLIAMVEVEHDYHQKVLHILEQLEGEMLSERHRIEDSPSVAVSAMHSPPSYEEISGVFASQSYDRSADNEDYFLGEVMLSYQAESDVELTLSVGDYVVVRKVSKNGWAEGECQGKAGWFPYGYVARREKILASKVTEAY